MSMDDVCALAQSMGFNAKKSFINMFGEKSEAIKKYISKNNVSVKDERNFQTILNYYNTL